MAIAEKVRKVATFLRSEMKCEIFLENQAIDDCRLDFPIPYSPIEHEHIIELCVCMGGDGTLLHLNSLFRADCPPVVCFNLGSLGFLTPFPFDTYPILLPRIIEEGGQIIMRGRISGTVSISGVPQEPYTVLNEIVIDRGPSVYLTSLEVFYDDVYITTVQADGLILATSTGSTAYSLSAGGSMIHPSVSAMIMTPICPHTLSFRPVILPDFANITVKVPEGARGSAWVSFDGRNRIEMKSGDYIALKRCHYPMATYTSDFPSSDWFGVLASCLQWNVRSSQGALNVATEKLHHPATVSDLDVPSLAPGHIHHASSTYSVETEQGSLSNLDNSTTFEP